MNRINVNMSFNVQGESREQTLEGRKYLVCPAAIGAEIVLNGSHGPGLYPKAQWERSVVSWNNKPITVYHPPKTAADKEVLELQRVGFLLNTNWSNDKFRTDLWYDVEKTQKVDPRVYDAVKNNQVMEVSTGLSLVQNVVSGVFNGKKYEWIGEDFQSDHLAVLPDQVGAYSISDGGGVNVTNQGTQILPISNEASFSEIEYSLRKSLYEAYQIDGYYWDGYIIDVFSDFFIYCHDGKCWKQWYTLSNEGVVSIAKDAPVEVKMRTDYVMVGNDSYIGSTTVNFSQKEIGHMEKIKIVNGLIEKGWFFESDRSMLMNQKDADLDKMAKEREGKEVKNRVKVTNTKDNPVVVNEEEIDEDIKAYYVSEKKRLVGIILKNEANQFPEDYLIKQTVNVLKGIVALANVSNKEATTSEGLPYMRENYAGAQGGPARISNVEVPEPLGVPSDY